MKVKGTNYQTNTSVSVNEAEQKLEKLVTGSFTGNSYMFLCLTKAKYVQRLPQGIGGEKMKEIKFRGKDINGIWIYGHYVALEDGASPVTSCIWQYGAQRATPVAIETVGQYTNLKDINKKEIYEGDIYEDRSGNSFIVEMKKEYGGYYPFATDGGCGCCTNGNTGLLPEEGVITGNIHDGKTKEAKEGIIKRLLGK